MLMRIVKWFLIVAAYCLFCRCAWAEEDCNNFPGELAERIEHRQSCREANAMERIADATERNEAALEEKTEEEKEDE